MPRDVAFGRNRRCQHPAAPAACAGRQIFAMKPIGTIDARGRRPPADVVARTIRDHLLRVAAARFCAGLSDRQAALILRAKLIRYREAAWPSDRSLEQCPARHRGTISELMWTILRIRDAIPGDRS